MKINLIDRIENSEIEIKTFWNSIYNRVESSVNGKYFHNPVLNKTFLSKIQKLRSHRG